MAEYPLYGVVIESKVSRTITKSIPPQVESVIGIIGAAKAKGIKSFPDIKTALAAKSDYEETSEVFEALKDIQACGIEAEIIVSGYEKDAGNDAVKTKEAALQAIADMENSDVEVGLVPTFVLATNLKGIEYFNKLKNLCENIRAIFFYECEKNTKNEIITEVGNCKSPRAVTSFQSVKRADAQNTVRPLSGFILGTWLHLIQANPSGLGETFSNKVVRGVSGIQNKISHSYSEKKDSDTYRANGITTIILVPEMKLWGDGVRDPDEVNSIDVIKDQLLADLLYKRLSTTINYLVDTRFPSAKAAVIDHIRRIMDYFHEKGVVEVYSIDAADKRNTIANQREGRFWVTVRFQTNTHCKFIGVTCILTDEFSEKIFAS